MEKKTFNPMEWLQPAIPLATDRVAVTNKIQTPEQGVISDAREQVENIIRQVEDRKLDIGTAYKDWRNIGFAFADAFGEEGRELFHRISSNYADYSESECNTQFTNCLKSNKSGITLKTYFYHAKYAGIPVGSTKPDDEPTAEPMPTFPDEMYEHLPDFLQRVVSRATSAEEKDLLLLGSIVAISACLPNMYGIYDGRQVYANLFIFITAQASAGKGRMVHCKQLVMPVHKKMREQAKLLKQEYETEMTAYNMAKSKKEQAEKPAKPPEKMLIIPANNSTTGVFQLLADSSGKGLIFETEGDTLAQAFKTDYGNYSDGFRKAFHHETISYYRRTDREYVDIETPCLSAVLSGTPKQIATLIPNAENGLFSRFIFYFMNVRTVWKDVFAEDADYSLDQYFDNLGNRFFELYQILISGPPIEFCFTAAQKEQFNTHFTGMQEKYLHTQGLDYLATVRRLGLITFRIAMILAALRILESGDISSRMICEERDFQSALSMVKVLMKHSSKVFSELPEDEKPVPRKNRKDIFLESLPHAFSRQQYLDAANTLFIPEKTAEGYISGFLKKGLIHRDYHDHYINLSLEAGQKKTSNTIAEIEDFKDIKDT